jgi:thiol-disulfide isomerase/thioredoxin
MNAKALPLTVLLCLATVTFAAAPTANELLAQAKTKAAAESKTIYVHFGASWCGWCKRLDAFLEQPDIKPVFEKYFVPLKLVAQENEKNKALENAGSDVLLQKLGGPDGLPYSAFLDAKGALIVNSKRESAGGGRNIGYPYEAQEIDWFVTMMKKAAPKMADADLKVIETALRTQKK